jgi:hypothetical protein
LPETEDGFFGILAKIMLAVGDVAMPEAQCVCDRVVEGEELR